MSRNLSRRRKLLTGVASLMMTAALVVFGISISSASADVAPGSNNTAEVTGDVQCANEQGSVGFLLSADETATGPVTFVLSVDNVSSGDSTFVLQPGDALGVVAPNLDDGSRHIVITANLVSVFDDTFVVACDSQVPTDVCPNIPDNQSEVPPGMIVDDAGNCVTKPGDDGGNTPPPPVEHGHTGHVKTPHHNNTKGPAVAETGA